MLVSKLTEIRTIKGQIQQDGFEQLEFHCLSLVHLSTSTAQDIQELNSYVCNPQQLYIWPQ